MSGFRDGIEGRWSVTSARHTIDEDGYRLVLQAELTAERAREEKLRRAKGAS